MQSFLDFIFINWLRILAVAVISYMLGSVCFSIIFTKFFKKGEDIRNLGSKSAGFTNVLRSVGSLPAVFTMFGDFLKCILAIYLTKLIFSHATTDFFTLQYISLFSGIFCSLGHVFPCWFNFKGGKSVLVSAATILMTDWKILLTLICIFLLLLSFCKIISLSSIVAAIMYPIFNVMFFVFRKNIFNYSYPKYYVACSSILCLIIAGIVLIRHKSNIERLLNGTEKQISCYTNKK